MTQRDRTVFDSDLDRRTILQGLGATALASTLAGCEHDDEPDDKRSGVFQSSSSLSVEVDGARGSDVNQERERLYFVESGTNALVRYDLIPEVLGTVSDGTATIDRTFRFDFDAGEQGTDEADVHWRFKTDTERQLEPRNGARIVRLPEADYSNLEARDLPSLNYSTDPIDGSTDDNDLTDGTVFAVETSEGNFAKAEVVSYGEDLEIEYETFEFADQRVVLGTGYDQPEDVVLAGDGSTAYVTERGGDGALLEVTLSNADRSNATVVSSGFGEAYQLALDRASGLGYVAADTEVVRVDLDDGTTTTVASGLDRAVGIVLDADGAAAYVSERELGASGGTATPDGPTGAIRRIDLGDGQKETIVDDLTAPHHLAWTDPSRDEILFVERDPENALSKLDVVTGDVTGIVGDTATNPASVSMLSADLGLICCENVIRQFDLTALIYGGASAPLFNGIGHIPVSSIDQDGYANTGPGFPFNVADAPFGGSLDLMIDHYRARAEEGATHYRVKVDGNVRDNSWNALEWDDTDRRYEPTEQSADGDGFFELRQNASRWYRPRLGYVLRTGSLSNGLHDLTVAFYSSASESDKVTEKSTKIRIDNEGPTARLGRIIHKLANGEEVVGACAIVDEPTDEFQFEVTATDPQDHLRHWKLVAHWGDNQHDVVRSESYADNGSGTSWTGPKNELVGDPDEGDPDWWAATERECAHTFHLRAWTRTINGYHYIQRDAYRKSLTLMLP